MTFEERYGEEPDFWHVVHDMFNLVDTHQWRHKLNATCIYGALWAIQWIANTEGHKTYTGVRKLWDNWLEQETRLPALIKYPPDSAT